MNNGPIGVFDSGLGGLTAMDVLTKLLPGEDIIYFGDSGRMPYGGRPRAELMQMGVQDIDFLCGTGAKLILAACGTLSTVALPTLAPISEVPVFGVIGPASRVAVEHSKSRKIGVIATQATITGGEYMRVMREMLPSAEITAIACPKFVPLIEAGKTSIEDAGVREAVEEYLTPVAEAKVDTLLLGCTHYPLLGEAISSFLGDGVKLISAGEEAAIELVYNLEGMNLKSGKKAGGMRKYYTSGDPNEFAEIAARLMPDVKIKDVEGIRPFDIL